MRATIGQYRVETVLGRGGMGVVYRGFHEALGRPVAIKALAPELTRQPEFRERFFSEAKTQARLQHPNVVGVYDLLEDEGDYFIVMELVTGTALDDQLQQVAGRGMHLGEALGICGQMLSALDYAHSEGVIHRDIKPSNVLLAAGGRVKLMDFGIALLVGDKRLTASQSAIGTPVYMSPEQILRPREVDHRTDIYSAAVVLYEMLAGRPPFDDDTEYGIKKQHVETPPPDLGALRSDLPAGVTQAIEVALAKSPDERFSSAGLFLRALHEAAPATVPSATPTPPPVPRPTTLEPATSTGHSAASTASPPAAPPARAALPSGNLRWLVLAAAVVVVLGIVGILALGFGSGGRGEAPAVAEVTDEPGEPGAVDPAASPRTGIGSHGTPAAPATEPGAAQLEGSSSIAPAVLAATPLARSETAPSQAPKPAAPPPAQPAPQPKKPASTPAPPKLAPPPAEPEPIEVEPEPAEATADEPEPEEPDSVAPTAAGIDQFAAMDDLIVSIERLSEQTYEAYEAENRDDRLLGELERFREAAEEARIEFRKATGTGIRGLGANLRGMLRRNRGGQQADSKILEIKVQEMTRRADEVDRQIATYSPGPATRDLWGELRRKLAELNAYF